VEDNEGEQNCGYGDLYNDKQGMGKIKTKKWKVNGKEKGRDKPK
jgi:hypothetical protein